MRTPPLTGLIALCDAEHRVVRIDQRAQAISWNRGWVSDRLLRDNGTYTFKLWIEHLNLLNSQEASCLIDS